MDINNPTMQVFDTLKTKTAKTMDALREEYNNLRAGRANPHLLDKIMVDYYGTMTPLNQVGNISVPEARLIVVSPWDVSTLKNIEKGILAANIGLTPSNDGKIIRLVFPELTEERRKDLVKKCKQIAEDSKVAVRNERRDAMEKLKKMKTDKVISEDDVTVSEKEIEKIVAKAIEQIDAIYKEKDKEVMSV